MSAKKKTTVTILSNSGLNIKEDVFRALRNKAMGYKTEEVVEEFIVENGKTELVKRKVSCKDYPPDLSSIMSLIEIIEHKELAVEDMTDEELEAEKEKLLQLLNSINA